MLLYIGGIYSPPPHCLNEFPVSVPTLAETTLPVTVIASIATHLQLQENPSTGASLGPATLLLLIIRYPACWARVLGASMASRV